MDYAARARAGGLCTHTSPFDPLRAKHRPRWARIFAITSGYSMKAMTLMALPQRAQRRRSPSYPCLISRAQARLAVERETVLPSSIVD
jgi:hypothetical protein